MRSDLGSLFMTIRLAQEVHNYCSKSPAIAQALLEHLFGSIPELQVAEFQYLQQNAAEPISKFLDYIT
ncbi:hypothetical protein H4R27_005600 [Coemansia aciculifera]|nr:hypothetical protein H4R27_005600 [Coemansia aciculifera]